MINLRNDYGSRFGILWIVLSLTGIDVFEDPRLKRCTGALILFRRWCFPTLLFANFCFLLTLPFIFPPFGYISFMDCYLPFYPIFLWMLIFKRRDSLKDLITHLSSIGLEDMELPRFFNWIINTAVLLPFVTAPVIITLSLLHRKPEHVSIEVQFRYLHEILFHSTVTVLYCGICYVFLKLLETSRTKFDSVAQFSDPQSVQDLVKNYLGIVKGLDIFRELFSTPVFLILFQNFAIVTVFVLDLLEPENLVLESMMPEAIFYTTYTLLVIGILIIMAAQIPVKMLRIKNTILNKMSLEAQTDEEIGNDKQQSLLLKRDVSVLSESSTSPLNIGFLLKAVGTVIVHIVVFSVMSPSGNIPAQ